MLAPHIAMRSRILNSAPVIQYNPVQYNRYAGSRRHASYITDSLPRVAQPSLWRSLIPKHFRKPAGGSKLVKPPRNKEWNPATFYIVIFLFIGSNAINMIALRNEFTRFTRQADQQLAKLREVIELVRQGKDVDVEAMLGTGDAQREQEWEEILKEIEQNDRDYVAERQQSKDRYQGNKSTKSISDKASNETEKASASDSSVKTVARRPVSFY